MKETGILFKGPLVRAILAGEKTVTRRLVKPQPNCADPIARAFDVSEPGIIKALCGDVGWRCPYGVPGDRLWVRETWRPLDATLEGHSSGVLVRYAADGAEHFYDDGAIPNDWSMPKVAARSNVSPLFLPRWASRLILEITDVSVERLQELTEEDAKAEGVTVEPVQGTVNGEPATMHPMTHCQAFIWLWDAINGKRASWASNPWVWRVAFRRVS